MPNDDVTPDAVGRYYDAWTARYLADFGDTFQACRPSDLADLHAYLLTGAGIEDGERILDAGCGVCGPSLYFAAHRAITVDAVTVSAAQVDSARGFIAAAGLEGRIKVHLADFHALHDLFPEATFDRVLFLESLSHAADPLEPLRSAFKVLKPGGTVYIKDFFEKQYAQPDMQRQVREMIARVDRAFVLKTPRVQRTVDALTQVGFIEHAIRPIGFTNDIAVWARFNETHQFDLYRGGTPFEWCDWFELRFRKPLHDDASPA